VLILLPPSEGKSHRAGTSPVDLDRLALPELNPVRERLLDTLTRLARGPLPAALRALGVSAGRAEDVAANAVLREAGALPAADRYTGVLYDALDLPGLRAEHPAAYAAAARTLLVFSGLWGVLRPDDAVPPYRCSVGARLPGTGPLATLWRGPLRAALTPYAAGRVVLDLRSAAYAAAWRPPVDASVSLVVGRVLREAATPGGGAPRRSVVSHFNKATKGRLTRALVTHLATAEPPDDPKRLADLVTELGFRAELTAPDEPGAAHTLDVIVDEP
jgi:hypothetical protein